MSQRKTLTDLQVAKLKPGPKRITIPDPLLRGHYVRVTISSGITTQQLSWGLAMAAA